MLFTSENGLQHGYMTFTQLKMHIGMQLGFGEWKHWYYPRSQDKPVRIDMYGDGNCSTCGIRHTGFKEIFAEMTAFHRSLELPLRFRSPWAFSENAQRKMLEEIPKVVVVMLLTWFCYFREQSTTSGQRCRCLSNSEPCPLCSSSASPAAPDAPRAVFGALMLLYSQQKFIPCIEMMMPWSLNTMVFWHGPGFVDSMGSSAEAEDLAEDADRELLRRYQETSAVEPSYIGSGKRLGLEPLISTIMRTRMCILAPVAPCRAWGSDTQPGNYLSPARSSLARSVVPSVAFQPILRSPERAHHDGCAARSRRYLAGSHSDLT
ncbi:hypothetical protein RJZ56_002878 [Blastomyces dermatitidis]